MNFKLVLADDYIQTYNYLHTKQFVYMPPLAKQSHLYEQKDCRRLERSTTIIKLDLRR